MVLETKRLLLRPWFKDDAQALYRYAKDSKIGPSAGWPVHTSLENSRQIIENVLQTKHNFAIVLNGEQHPVGSIGLMIGPESTLGIGSDEGEIGYWIAVPFWGRGLVSEAVRELLRYGFEDLNLVKIWCGHFAENENSRRVQEKCGLCYHHTVYNKPFPLINQHKTEHATCLSRQAWQKKMLSAGNIPD